MRAATLAADDTGLRPDDQSRLHIFGAVQDLRFTQIRLHFALFLGSAHAPKGERNKQPYSSSDTFRRHAKMLDRVHVHNGVPGIARGHSPAARDGVKRRSLLTAQFSATTPGRTRSHRTANKWTQSQSIAEKTKCHSDHLPHGADFREVARPTFSSTYIELK